MSINNFKWPIKISFQLQGDGVKDVELNSECPMKETTHKQKRRRVSNDKMAIWEMSPYSLRFALSASISHK